MGMRTTGLTSDFWRGVASVLTGTAVAQAIPIAGSLIIARQYAPGEFGRFSAWLGLVLLAAVALTGRFETALALEPDGEPRRRAMVATLLTAALATGLLVGAAAIVVAISPAWVEHQSTLLIAAFFPVALLIAMGQIWQSWAAAEGRYRDLSLMRIAEAGAITTLQIALGAAFASADSLAIAHLIGVMVGLAVSARLLPIRWPAGNPAPMVREFWSRHRRFPLLSLPADVLNTASAQLPVLIVAGRFGAETAGLLALATRTLGAPIGILGKSVLDVFKRHAATSYRERGECRADYLRTFKVLATASLVAAVVLALWSAPLFALAFGEAWRGAGTIAAWLVPMFALRFVSSPLSYMVYIAEKQHLDLVWQACLLGMTLASLNLFSQQSAAIIAYSAGYSVLYIVYLMMSYRFSLGDRR
jgi:O-antigen/teichoic acid export membrane protein